MEKKRNIVYNIEKGGEGKAGEKKVKLLASNKNAVLSIFILKVK
jgi:hypothetical protein